MAMLALFGLGVRSADRAAPGHQGRRHDRGQCRAGSTCCWNHDLREPIRFGIGIHGGEVIVGDIGYRDHMVFTALGDAVNVAARLQDMTKTLAAK